MVTRQAGRSIIEAAIRKGKVALPANSFHFRIAVMAVLVAVLSATAGVAFWKMTQMRSPQSQEALLVLPEPRVIDDFRLKDTSGLAFTLNELRGSWTLMFFGFTHCPDVCPTALYELQQVQDQLERELPDGAPIPRVVFVSVDPERDTSDKLAQYLSHFDPDFVGVSGSDEQLLPFTRQVGIAYRIEDHDAGTLNYSVDHSSGILLMNPAGKLYGVFPAPHRAELMANDLVNVLENS